MSSLMPADDKARDVGHRGIGREALTPRSWQAMAPSDGAGDGEVKEVKAASRSGVLRRSAGREAAPMTTSPMKCERVGSRRDDGTRAARHDRVDTHSRTSGNSF